MKKPDLVEAVFSAAAAWLAWRGQDPRAIGDRAQACAQSIETVRTRIEALAMAQVRTAMMCRAPKPCDCLVCTAYADAAKASKAKPS